MHPAQAEQDHRLEPAAAGPPVPAGLARGRARPPGPGDQQGGQHDRQQGEGGAGEICEYQDFIKIISK